VGAQISIPTVHNFTTRLHEECMGSSFDPVCRSVEVQAKVKKSNFKTIHCILVSVHISYVEREICTNY